MAGVYETTPPIKAAVNIESLTEYLKNLMSLQTCNRRPRYELLYAWHKRNNIIIFQRLYSTQQETYVANIKLWIYTKTLLWM
jgi:hypothetical protein